MTNPPTTRAMMAKTRKMRVMNDSDWAMSLCVSSVIWVPVSTSTLSSCSESFREATTSSSDTPSSATTTMSWKRPSSPTSFWAAGVVHSTKLAPAGLSAVPKRAMPTSV